jgi:hypothetical protein
MLPAEDRLDSDLAILLRLSPAARLEPLLLRSTAVLQRQHGAAIYCPETSIDPENIGDPVLRRKRLRINGTRDCEPWHESCRHFALRSLDRHL